MAAALGVGTFPQFALGALGPHLRVDLGIGPRDLGLVLAVLFATVIVTSPIAGPFADRLGGRRACALLLATGATALTLASFADGRIWLMAAMLPAGAAMALANPGTNRWAAAAPSARAQASLVGVAQAGVQAGALAAGALASLTAAGAQWQTVLRAGAVVAVLGLVATWFGPPDVPRRTPAKDTSPEPVPDAAGPITSRSTGTSPVEPASSEPDQVRARSRTLPLLALYAALMGAATASAIAYLPSFGTDVVGVAAAAAAATTAVYGAVALVCRLGLSAALRRTDGVPSGWLTVMAVGAAMSIGVVALAGRAPVWLWIGAAAFGATGVTWPAVAFLGVVRASPAGQAGRAAGWITAAFYVGLWLGAPVGGQIISAHGYGAVWAGAAALYLLAVLPAVRAGRTPTP
jgi:predicted MFS family arabinose efflux permease